MEHIVQFGITIDDDAIRRRVEANAEKTIIENIQQSVAEQIFQNARYHCITNAPYTGSLTDYAGGLVSEFLEAHKDEIIRAAGKELANRLVRTKAAKSLLTEASNQ